MYRLRLAEKKRFSYGSAYLYEQIRKMHELQEEYLLVVNYDVKSFGDLYRLKFRLQNVDEELCKAQKELYRDRASQKRSCKTTEDMVFFEASEDDYRNRLEQIKMQKKDNHKKLKAVERCLERDGSLKEAELELRVPVDKLGDITDMYKVEVPENPYRVVGDIVVAEETVEEFVKDSVAGIIEESVEEPVEETVEIVPVREDAIIIIPDVDEETEEHLETFDEKVPIITGYEPNIIGGERVAGAEQIAEIPSVPKLPSNKADYMRMSVAEKVRCYELDTKGTDKAFGMVKAYFQSVGMDAGFDEVYEETKLLTDYCEKAVAEHQISEKTEQILQRIDVWDINLEQISKYSIDILSDVFDFSDVDYYTGIKLFSVVLNRKGVSLEHQERYELFEKIYEEGMREKRQENTRGERL